MKLKFFKIFSIFFIILNIFMSISIYADDEIIENYSVSEDIFSSIETSSDNISSVPNVNSRHSVVFDRCSKQILYGKNEMEKCKMASTTKIMTAIIVLENSNLKDIVTVSKKSAGTGGSRLGLSTNDEISVENLLYGLMMKSGNDAAVALAEHIGGSVENFAVLMNKKANELGLSSTNFVTPHGLDNDIHYTTAYDLACLTDYALKNETFAKIVRTKNYTIQINGQPKVLSNTNELLGNFEGIYGVKTGFTNGANRCLVTSCKRGDLDVICVVLGCDTKKDRTQDSVKLLNYVFNNFTVINVKDILVKKFEEWSSTHRNCFTVNKGISNELELYLNENNFQFIKMAVNKRDVNKVSTDITFNSYYNAPLQANSKIGKVSLKLCENNCYSVDILNKNVIPKKSVFDYVFYIFGNYCSFF